MTDLPYPDWYRPPSDDAAKKAYDDKVADFLLGEVVDPSKDAASRRANDIALEKLRTENAEALRKAQLESEQTAFVDLVTEFRTVITGTVERSRDTAKYVQTASVAASGLYTGLLALVFGVADKGADLPLRAAIPTLFFGLAVAFSTWFLAHIPDSIAKHSWPEPTSLPRENVKRNLDFYSSTVNGLVTARAWAMRLASVYLVLAVITLPVAFVSPPAWFDGAVHLLEDATKTKPAVSPTPTAVPVTPPPTGSAVPSAGCSCAGGVAVTAEATAEATWPPTPSFQPGGEKLALELYKRQLDAFQEAQKGKPTAPSAAWDVVLLALALIVAAAAYVRRSKAHSSGTGPTDSDGKPGVGLMSLRWPL